MIVTTNSTLNLTVTNTGNSAIGAISGIGTNTSPFSRITNGSFPADARTAEAQGQLPGASCTVKVRFAPTAVGAATATVTVNGTVPTVNTVLTGIGDAPPAPATPTGGSAQRGGTGTPITASLNWNTVAYAASYDVQWSTSQATINANTGTVIANATSTPPYTFNGGANGLATGTTVYFKVRARNSTGVSNWSAAFNSTVR